MNTNKMIEPLFPFFINTFVKEKIPVTFILSQRLAINAPERISK